MARRHGAAGSELIYDACMEHSTNRILTTHAGRLDGPPEFRAATMAMFAGGPFDAAAFKAQRQSALVDVIRRQAEAGIDIITDGELGKTFGVTYYGQRLSGLTTRKLRPGEPAIMTFQTGERLEFADFYKELNFMRLPEERSVCSGPIAYTGQEEIANDLASFRAALKEANVQTQEKFVCALSPGWLEHFFHNEYYGSDEEYIFALADAYRHEYKAIVDAGFVLQIDDPALPDTYDMIVPNPAIEEYRKFADCAHRRIEPRAEGPAGRSRSLSHVLGKLAWTAHARSAAEASGRSDAEGKRGSVLGGSGEPAA